MLAVNKWGASSSSSIRLKSGAVRSSKAGTPIQPHWTVLGRRDKDEAVLGSLRSSSSCDDLVFVLQSQVSVALVIDPGD